MKHLMKFMTALALLFTAMTGAGAQTTDPTVSPVTGQTNQWQFTMPAGNVELEVEYETALALNETIDNTATLDEWNGYEADVTLTRTLQTSGWSTFAVPFNISAAELSPKGITAVKELTASSLADGTLTLTFADATTLEAGKPYLVKVSATVENPVFEGVTVSNSTTTTTTIYVDFVPVVNATTVGSEGDDVASVLFVGAGNKLYNPTELPSKMKGFRAYFAVHDEAASAARRFVLNIEGEGTVTGIIGLSADSEHSADGGIYTLDGRKVGSMAQKGIYIVNGKKVVK